MGRYIMILAMALAMPVAAKESARASAAIEMPLSETVREYRDWRIERSSAFIAALTNNPDGSLFGLLCGKTCSYYLNTGQICDVGADYPGLLSAAEGSIPVTLRCLHVKEEGEEYSILLIDEDLTEALKGASQIGVVVPLENGQFHVSRFSMAGAAEAQRDMLNMTDKRKDTGDFTL